MYAYLTTLPDTLRPRRLAGYPHMGTDLNDTTIDRPHLHCCTSDRESDPLARCRDGSRRHRHHSVVASTILRSAVILLDRSPDVRSARSTILQPSDVRSLARAAMRPSRSGRFTLSREHDLALTTPSAMADYRHARRRVRCRRSSSTGPGELGSMFIENVARDGILLWSRAPLPAPFAPIAERAVHELVESQTPD